MKFMVRRTSVWDDRRPCDEAVQEPYTRIDVRTASAPDLIPAYKGQSAWWYKEGTNHRVEGGWIKRDFPATGWFVEIDTLDELIAFQSKYGKIIVMDAYDAACPCIEIYDGYRE